MELSTASRLIRDPGRYALREQYVRLLPISAERKRELLARAEHCSASEPGAAMARVHQTLAGADLDGDNPAWTSIASRLELACDGTLYSCSAVIARDVQSAARLVSTPPLNRTPMAPKLWPPSLLSALPRRESPKPRRRWSGVGTVREMGLGAAVLAQTYVATNFMVAVLPYHGNRPLEFAALMLFAILFAWVSAGFWTAVTGFFLLMFGRDRYAISATAAADDTLIDPGARTAIVMPICNEDVTRVFAGLRATYESLAQTADLRHFDFFVLSDTSDPDRRIAELHAWLEMCGAVGGFGRVFYRWRKHRIKRKSGNIADFCRRWGRNYRYMVVLDADSVMSGRCLTTLVRLMEANPNAGIIQTAPLAAGHDTLYARIQQFANRVYGPAYVAGTHFFHLGEAYYWGHNAIIRVAPFIQHCALGRLPGRSNLSGEILSHDFVEAALMRRAGWGVWIAYDLPGSYEEMPPNLIDELKRDRRWCQGNLMNFRFSLARGLHPAHRAVFVSGVMAYLSAPLWFAFLMLSTVLLAVHVLVAPEYFMRPSQLFPLWPEWHPVWGAGLYTATATLLFLPKILSVALAWREGAGQFGGRLRLASSMLAELVFSMLLAPIRMLFHTRFVITALCGWTVQWKSPPRQSEDTTWRDALRYHGLHTLFGLAWAAVVYWLNPAYLWWLLPVMGALIISIPISVYSSRVSLGRRLRGDGFFLIPEESQPPSELRRTRDVVQRAAPLPGFVDAVVDPMINALAGAFAPARYKRSGTAREEQAKLVQHALINGPEGLTVAQKIALLRDPIGLSRLHFQIWTSPQAHDSWGRARASVREGREPEHGGAAQSARLSLQP